MVYFIEYRISGDYIPKAFDAKIKKYLESHTKISQALVKRAPGSYCITLFDVEVINYRCSKLDGRLTNFCH